MPEPTFNSNPDLVTWNVGFEEEVKPQFTLTPICGMDLNPDGSVTVYEPVDGVGGTPE